MSLDRFNDADGHLVVDDEFRDYLEQQAGVDRPGRQRPYTPREQAAVDVLMRGACEAEEMFDLDELEAYAAAHKDKQP